ncbi:hypothetical protein Tco_0026478 [Tanacetum coccineum]
MAANAPLAVFVITKRTPLAANLLNQTHPLVRWCGGSSGGWSGGDGDDMVSVDGDSGGTRGGVEVARGGEWGSRSSRSEEDLQVYGFLCSPEFGRKRWPAADRWSPKK